MKFLMCIRANDLIAFSLKTYQVLKNRITLRINSNAMQDAPRVASQADVSCISPPILCHISIN